jgi:hypothetical protein
VGSEGPNHKNPKFFSGKNNRNDPKIFADFLEKIHANLRKNIKKQQSFAKILGSFLLFLPEKNFGFL